jgi:cyclic pyranopterin phosphate synthase
MPRETYGEDYVFLSPEDRLSYDEIVRLVGLFARLGVSKVKLTGGEPLLRPWLHTLIERVIAVPGIEDVGLITNGYRLAKVAARLKLAGLHRVTVSLDTLDEDTWQKINGRGYPVSRILSGIQAAVAVGFSPVKINTVVQRGVNDHQIMEMVRAFRDPGYQLRFIEYMDVGTLNHWRRDKVVPSKEILDIIDAEFPLEATEPNYRGEVARRYRYVDGCGEVGFISSVTEPFCRDCTRARLSAEGRLYTCLFARDGLDLRTPLRSGASDEEIHSLLVNAWGNREDRYSELRSETGTSPRIEMFQIGG